MSYLIGYGSNVVDLTGLQAWSQWQNTDPEFARRLVNIMDAAATAGRPLGVGNTFRSFTQQLNLFLSRHSEVLASDTHCCQYGGRFYQLHAGAAHAAPPGLSYHEATTPDGKCLAADMTGDMAWLDANCGAYGLRWISPEPWHVQPVEVPTSRSGYNAATMAPLPVWGAVPAPTPVATKVWAPQHDIRGGYPNNAVQVRALQSQCNFWGWRDNAGRVLTVDGICGKGGNTEQAIKHMQTALKVAADGWYGAQTQAALQSFLDAMSALAQG